jgi:hypothetical protein
MRCVPGNIWERYAGAMSVTSWAKLVIVLKKIGGAARI